MARLWVFDWDGTLVDSLGRIEQCMAQAIGDCGLPVREPGEIRNIIGLGLAEAIATLFPDAGPQQCQNLRDRYAERFAEADTVPCGFHDRALETLQALRERGDCITVATGKSRRGLDRALRAHGLQDWFDATRCADESVSKPAPHMVLELLACTGFPAERALVVGDTEYDLGMARAAGAGAVAVSFGAHHPDRLAQYRPLLCVSHLPQLLEWRDSLEE